jgi:hypothetical protein
MAEIAIISQDFCTIQELTTQGTTRIDYKSIPPYVLARYALGPFNDEIPDPSGLNYGSGFLKRVGVMDTKTGSLRISGSSRDGATNYPGTVLDMDNNRIINLGDANDANPSELHHAVNLRVGDRRYLRKESWSPESERTMNNDLLFNGNLTIKRTNDAGKLTINGGYSANRAKIELDSTNASINLITDASSVITTPQSVAISAPSISTQASNVTTVADNINLFTQGAVNMTGNLSLNPDLTKSVFNLKSFTYAEVVGTSFDSFALTVKDFKRHQKCENVAGPDATNRVNVFKDTTSVGVHRFRRIVGGNNIQVKLQGDEIIIDNTAALAASIDATNLNAAGIVSRINQLFPPANFGVGTFLRVLLEYPNSGTVGALSIVVNNGLKVSTTTNIGRGITSVSIGGSITATGSVPAASQPVYSLTRVQELYINTGSTWAKQ